MSEIEQVQLIATIVRDIGAPIVISIGLLMLGWRLVRIFGEGDKRGDSLLDKALESMGGLSAAIDAMRKAEEAKAELFQRLVNTTDKTYQQLETLTLATDAVMGSVDKLSTETGVVKSKVVNIETVMQSLREMAEKNAQDHQAVSDRLEGNAVILTSIQQIMDNWQSDVAKISAIHRMLDEWDKPPTPPADKDAPKNVKPLNADGAQDDALPKTGTEG